MRLKGWLSVSSTLSFESQISESKLFLRFQLSFVKSWLKFPVKIHNKEMSEYTTNNFNWTLEMNQLILRSNATNVHRQNFELNYRAFEFVLKWVIEYKFGWKKKELKYKNTNELSFEGLNRVINFKMLFGVPFS